MRLGDKEEVTYEATTTALRKAVRLNRAIQAPDGHWAAENAGPMFFTPPLVSLLNLSLLNSKLRTTCLFYEFRYRVSILFYFLKFNCCIYITKSFKKCTFFLITTFISMDTQHLHINIIHIHLSKCWVYN